MSIISDGIIGKTHERMPLNSYDDNHQAALRLISQAEREILFFSYDLQSRMVDFIDITAALSAFLRSSRKAQAKILLSDNQKVVKSGHRWIELIRKLSSKVELRKVSVEHLNLIYCTLIIDNTALLYKKEADHYSGYLEFNAPELADKYKQEFLNVWEHASTDSELLPLHL